ncbi:MAG TPA: OmpH family outer membrane protein [Pirellulaceae bacterium]|nr:OmpH family outer membrane protein [Pirellulaceae bacterium]HMO93425.1 OmpH family outer membrane protein [Pirellulaceae bacterium]HMP71404.1 OmpH family outer membrane protein [Pirellulaceae bacterium]
MNLFNQFLCLTRFPSKRFQRLSGVSGLAAILILQALSVGCGKPTIAEQDLVQPSSTTEASQATAIAVIDLNRVAEQIGAIERIRTAVADYEFELRNRLTQIKDQFELEISEKRSSQTDDLNRQDQGELDKLMVKHQSALEQQTLIANNELVAHENQLKLKLLNQVRPIAYEVANERGMSIVLTTAQVYAATPTSDITDEVAKRIKKINSEAQSNVDKKSNTRVANLPGGGEFKAY